MMGYLAEINSWTSLFFHLDLGHSYVLFQLLAGREISKLFVLADNLQGEVESPGDRVMTACEWS